MSLLSEVKEKSKVLQKRIVLAEGEDPRILDAASEILNLGLSDLVLLGDVDKIRNELKNRKVNVECGVINPKTSPKREEFVQKYYEMRRAKGMSLDEAASSMAETNYFAAMMVRENLAAGAVMGAVYTTADVLRAGLRVIGVKPGNRTVSSFFIMVTDKKDYGFNGTFLFADCAVNPNPDSRMLADIAIATSENCERFLHTVPYTALLSFSTKGSASDESTKKILSALEIIKNEKPNLLVDGELQLDASIVASVAERKAKGSYVAGKANILIFPDLNSGNIGYKLVERFASAEAIGPIIQGFAKPINDLSRGASYHDVVNMACITSIMAD